MTTYQLIDAICDGVNPILFIIAVALLIIQATKKQYARAVFGLLFLALSLVYVYSLMFFDASVGIWATFGGDYSTHTAFAVAVSLSIILSTSKILLLLGVLVTYAILMLYQQYHSLLDIITTLIAVGVPLLMVSKVIQASATLARRAQ